MSGTIDPSAAAAIQLTLIEDLRVAAAATSDRKRLVHSIDVALASSVSRPL
jgi:hypothetical protein